MRTKVLRDAACPAGKQCPAIARTDSGYEVVGTNVPDATLPAHERRVLVPVTMLPELGRLDIADFEDWLSQRRTAPGDMLRVQTRRAYAVSSDDADFAGYLAGAPTPVSPYREPFFQELREDRVSGKVWRNLVVIDGAPSDYQRYANEWVYTYAAEAGQDNRILDLVEHPTAEVLLRAGDFWVVEHQHVALVRYDDADRHCGEVAVEDSSATGYIVAAELAWQLGTPFPQWFAAHPQYLRRNRAA